MPNPDKTPRLGGTENLLPKPKAEKPGFDPRQSKPPKEFGQGRKGKGKPKLFPGRTGGR